MCSYITYNHYICLKLSNDMEIYVVNSIEGEKPRVFGSMVGVSKAFGIGYHKLVLCFGRNGRSVFDGDGLKIWKVDLERSKRGESMDLKAIKEDRLRRLKETLDKLEGKYGKKNSSNAKGVE